MTISLKIHRFYLISFIYLFLAKIKAKIKKKEETKSSYPYAIQGCFFGIKEEFANIIANDYDGFLFGEENYLAEMVIKHKHKIYYNSTVKILHKEKSSTRLLDSKYKAKYYRDSLKYIIDKFY
jgi:GT2 family glycosyltransferase